MRRLTVLGVTCIILLQIPGWATATEVVVNDTLKTYMQGTLNACAWAATRAHKGAVTWQADNNPAVTCKTDGISQAVSNPPDAIATHADPKDQVHASADAQCKPGCATFTMHNSATVISKPHSIAAGSYARGGTGLTLVAGSGGVLKGPLTVTFSQRMDLSSGTDPYESVFALAITDQSLNEWNRELAELLAITDPPSLPEKMCMAPPEGTADAKKHCGDPKNLRTIEFREPYTTYFKLVVKLNVNGQLDVNTSGAGTMLPPISEQDFEVKSVPCKPPAPRKSQQQCFTANIKEGTELTRKIELEPIHPKRNSRPLAIDVINGIVALPPFESRDKEERSLLP